MELKISTLRNFPWRVLDSKLLRWEEDQVAAVDVWRGLEEAVKDCKPDSIWFRGCEGGERLMDRSPEGQKTGSKQEQIYSPHSCKNVVCTAKSVMKDRNVH